MFRGVACLPERMSQVFSRADVHRPDIICAKAGSPILSFMKPKTRSRKSVD
jgi:hypothetical protein